jgi:uncharacterized cupredoxin-like copper-binding protein
MKPSYLRVFRLEPVLSACLVACLLVACSDAAPGPTTPSAATVTVSLASFSLSPSPASAPAGSVTFNISNTAAEDVHEFVVVQSDLAAGELPIGAEGAIDESALTVVDEVEEMAPGASASLTVDLAAGHYVLLCNVPGHYGLGMRADFTVNP